jgi:protein involved in polysaccharide export with SLBB domain
MTKSHALICSLFAACFLAACSDGPIQGSPDALQQAKSQSIGYELSPGDQLHIAVFGEDNLSGDYTIAPDGTIALPLAGNLQAAGLTVPGLQSAVTNKLKTGYVLEPKVTVTANNLRPFYILGEVNKPGKYAFMPDLTVLDAVATAEGFTYRANMSRVFVRHVQEASEKEVPLTSTTAVLPGDTIRIGQRYF